MKKYLLPVLVLGNLISSLCYLSVSRELKYSKEVAFTLFNNKITFIDAFSAWVFGMYLIWGIIHKLSSVEGKSELDKYFSDIHYWTLSYLGIMYFLHYMAILQTNSLERIAFILGYIFLLSLRKLYLYRKDSKLK